MTHQHAYLELATGSTLPSPWMFPTRERWCLITRHCPISPALAHGGLQRLFSGPHSTWVYRNGRAMEMSTMVAEAPSLLYSATACFARTRECDHEQQLRQPPNGRASGRGAECAMFRYSVYARRHSELIPRDLSVGEC